MNYGPPQPGFNVAQQQPPFAAPGGYPYPPPNQGGYMPPDQNIPMLGPGEVAMPMPQVSVPNCPLGLEYLTQVRLRAFEFKNSWTLLSGKKSKHCTTNRFLFQIDQLLVKQKRELLEAFIGFETKNKYSIKNSLGQKVYYAKEVRLSARWLGFCC